MERTYCVYKHTNKVNGKVYIGITSQRPARRWDCGRGYQKNEHFWRAIQKYGWENFDHEILHKGLPPEEAFRREQELILEYESQNYHKGYNVSSGGEGGATGLGGENHPMYGKHHTQETLEKLSAAKKGVPYSPERYAAFLENLDREALRERAYRTIVGYNKGKPRDPDTIKKIAESNRGRKRSTETRKKLSDVKKVPVLQFTIDGELVREWDGLVTAARALSIQVGHISKVCKNQRKTAGGFIWKYKPRFSDSKEE